LQASSVHIPVRANLALGGALVALHICALVLLPAIGAAIELRAIALALMALMSPMLWALVHESIHGLLLPQRAQNRVFGRILAICFGTPLRAVRFGHLRHHRYNRSALGREEIFDARTRSHFAAYCFHFVRITFGLYAGEVLLCFACWLPRAWLRNLLRMSCPEVADKQSAASRIAERELLSIAAIAEIRFDAAMIIALYASAFHLYGGYWPLLAGTLIVRAFLASQLDHAPHHGTPLHKRDHALNMIAPRYLQLYILGFNFHRTHHQHPSFPWTTLLREHVVESGDITLLSAVLRQWRGPIELGAALESGND
jgi:fatty acid desaturase